jgi:hypothetical protein
VFDQLGQRIERHHHRRLGPLADDERASHGDGHERVDAELAEQQRLDAALVDAEPGDANGDCGQHHAEQPPRLGVGQQQVAQFGRQRDGERCRDARPGRQRAVVVPIAFVRIVARMIVVGVVIVMQRNLRRPGRRPQRYRRATAAVVARASAWDG